MALNPQTQSADVRLQGNQVAILGYLLLLEGAILRSHARSFWLKEDTLRVTWDLARAQSEYINPDQPYESGHSMAVEGRIEASDVVLVEFEQVDHGPVPRPLETEDRDDLVAPGVRDSRVDDRVDNPRRARARGGRSTGSRGSIFDNDPRPQTVRRTVSLLEAIRRLEERNGELSRRINDLEDRIRHLENG